MFEKERSIRIITGWLFILLVIAVFHTDFIPFKRALSYLEFISYDEIIRHFHPPLSQDSPVMVVDIDDESLKAEGRWPWERERMSRLVSSLNHLGAKIIALDILFAEAERNAAESVIETLQKLDPSQNQSIIPELKAVEPIFDFDHKFAKSIEEGAVILGFSMSRWGPQEGELPSPLFTLTPELEENLSIPDLPNYIANLPILQQSAKGSGFINSKGDVDGVIRFSPLLYRRNASVYPSLALEAIHLFFPLDPIELVLEKYDGHPVLEGIRVGNRRIPLDAYGKILVPFRGPSYTIPYVSATKILQGKVDPKQIEGKIVFIGSSGTAMGDLVASAISPVFPGIEVHAQIAASIIDGYLPYKPVWAIGAQTALLFIIGGGCALILPLIGPISGIFLVLFLIFGLIGMDCFVWVYYNILFSSIFIIAPLIILIVFNEVVGLLVEKKKKLMIRALFSHYIPPARVDMLIEKGEKTSLDGETKTLTVLFADIRNFTTLSEGFSAAELKAFLNHYLSDMTTVIFENKGTVDKYIGDLVMAFWGAPIDDPNHPINGIKAAFGMQEKLKSFSNPPLRIGIGLNTGSMNLGDMGSKYRQEYTVIGDSVNVASRLESITKFYHVPILVGPETYEKTKEEVEYLLIDRVRLMGKQHGIEIYQPLCMKGECSATLQKRSQLHAEALSAYFKRDWDVAEKLFSSLQPEEKELYALYLDRIRLFRTSPPPSDWDGTFTLSSK